MKKIVLIGDSIRFGATGSPGYGVYVKKMFEGEAEVFMPNDNCRFLQYTLRYLHAWAEDWPKEEIGLVHWNNGLWDVLRILGDEPFTDIDTYGCYLLRVHARIRQLFPRAKIVFALSTSVKEEWGRPDFFRHNKDIEAYNQKAIEVLTPLGVAINDLYTTTSHFEDPMRSDWVHFGEEGSFVLAEQVVKVCQKALEE